MKPVNSPRKDSSIAISTVDKAYVQGYRSMKGLAHDKDGLAEIIDFHRKAYDPAAAGSPGKQAVPQQLAPVSGVE
jgi:hypothetical protein